MEKTLGIIIKCKDYSETSQLIWLYTKDFGKLKVIAKGSRGNSKKFKNKLDLFNIIELIFYHSQHRDLHTLGECYVIEQFPSIRGDLDKFATATYFAELIDSCTGVEDKNLKIYSLFFDELTRLSSNNNYNFCKCIFEIRFLHYLGHLPKFEYQQGLTKGALAICERIKNSASLETLKISELQMEELRSMLRLIIDYLAGKRLKSLDFIESLSCIL